MSACWDIVDCGRRAPNRVRDDSGSRQVGHVSRPRVTTGSLAHRKTKPRSTPCPFAPRTSADARPVTASAATPRTKEKTVLRLKTRFPRKRDQRPKSLRNDPRPRHSPDVSEQPRTPRDTKCPLPRRKRSPVVTQLVNQGHHWTKNKPLQWLIQTNSTLRFRCSKALLVLVGDIGIEPVTSSVSGVNTVLSTPPLSTKTVRGRPPTSAHIRGRCHAISQSPRHTHTSEHPRTVHTHFPREALPRMIWNRHARPLDPDTIAVPNTG